MKTLLKSNWTARGASARGPSDLFADYQQPMACYEAGKALAKVVPRAHVLIRKAGSTATRKVG